MTTPDYTALVQAALEARKQARIPYSHFAVGAAVLGASGTIYPGCNIENAAYPATVCAERVALFNAWAAGEREFLAIAVTADTHGPVSPCGTCRQVIFELAANATVVLTNTSGDQQITSPSALLPGGFTPGDLPG